MKKAKSKLPPNTIIEITKQEHLKTLYKILDEQGYKWFSGHRLTTETFDPGKVAQLVLFGDYKVAFTSMRNAPIKRSDFTTVYSCDICRPEKIIIYQKGNRVIAKEISTNIEAEAKCNPSDAFNFAMGAKLALNRLIGDTSPVKEYKLSDIDILEETIYNPARNASEVKSVVIKDRKTGDTIFQAY